MKYKKNKFLIFFIVNIFLLLIIVLLAIPATKFLNKINLDNNEFVKEQKIVNPKAISPQIIDRTMSINFVAEVDSNLNWELNAVENKISLKIGKSKIIADRTSKLFSSVGIPSFSISVRT